jgi:hypothetical protein
VKELTPEEIREIAEKVMNKGQKGGRMAYIDTTDELVEKYCEFMGGLWRASLEDDDLRTNQERKAIEALIVRVSEESFKRELPGLLLLFRRYQIQR